MTDSPKPSASPSVPAKKADDKDAVNGVTAKGVSPEVQEAILARVQSASGTAAGVAVAEAARDDVPKGEDRGSTKESGAMGLQDEAAIITPSGSLGAKMVGSPSGPVPVGVLTRDPEEAAKLLLARNRELAEQATTREMTEYDEAFLSKLSAAEIRAVGHDRGYDMVARGGRRSTARDFLRFQAEDTRVGKKASKPTAK